MYKFLRKNQKKLLAVFAVGLMIAFTVQLGTPRAAMRAGGGVTIGHIGQDKVTLDQVRQAEIEWDLLTRIVSVTGMQPPQPEFVPLVQQLGLTNQFFADMKEHPETYVLLLEEARRMGVQPSSAVVEELMSDPRLAVRLPDRVVPFANAPQDTTEKIRFVLTNLVTIFTAENRAAETVKISRPLLNHRVISLSQSITLRAVPFDALEFLANAPQPTPEQLQQQFQKYADADPEVAARDNQSLGFGYRYPNRVKLQYISIPAEEVKRVVKATKDDYAWELEAHKYYIRNTKEFAMPAPSPTSVPASDPGSAATAPSTRPTTQPFDQVRQTILQRVMEPEVERLTREVQGRIQATLSNDYEKLTPAQSAAEPTTGPAAPTTQPAKSVATSTPSSLGVPLESYDYLKALAERIQKEFGVLPGIGAVGEFKTANELNGLPGIGAVHVGIFTFGQYVTAYAEPFVPPEYRKRPEVLSLFEPSQPISDRDGNLYIVRITAADPAHKPADLSEVADRVKADWQKAWAYDQAKTAADTVVKTAQSSSLDSAAGDRKLVVAGPFDEYSAAPIQGSDLSDDALPWFKREAFKLVADLARQPDVKHPLRLIELPRQARVFAAELQTVTSDPRPLHSNVMMAEASRELRREYAQPIIMTWFTYQGVVNRLNYVDEPGRSRTASSE